MVVKEDREEVQTMVKEVEVQEEAEGDKVEEEVAQA